MQHGHVQKKLNVLDPEGHGWDVNGQNFCYHVAAFVIPFNLICNMIMF